MLYLSEEVKLGIVSGAIGILILMVICMTCKLSRLHKQPIYLEYTERKADAKLPPTQAFPKYIPECSDCVREQLSQMSDETGQQPTKKPITVKSKGTIKFSMVYQSNVQTLLLGVIEANHLVGKDFWDTVDSYVKARLHPDADGVHKGQTDICRKSRNPKFGQTLEFNVPFDEIGEMTLLLSVWELDKYSRHRIIGEAQLELGHVIQVDEPVEFDKDLRSFEKVGELYSFNFHNRFRTKFLRIFAIRGIIHRKRTTLNSSTFDFEIERVQVHLGKKQTMALTL